MQLSNDFHRVDCSRLDILEQYFARIDGRLSMHVIAMQEQAWDIRSQYETFSKLLPVQIAEGVVGLRVERTASLSPIECIPELVANFLHFGYYYLLLSSTTTKQQIKDIVPCQEHKSRPRSLFVGCRAHLPVAKVPACTRGVLVVLPIGCECGKFNKHRVSDFGDFGVKTTKRNENRKKKKKKEQS